MFEYVNKFWHEKSLYSLKQTWELETLKNNFCFVFTVSTTTWAVIIIIIIIIIVVAIIIIIRKANHMFKATLVAKMRILQILVVLNPCLMSND